MYRLMMNSGEIYEINDWDTTIARLRSGKTLQLHDPDGNVVCQDNHDCYYGDVDRRGNLVAACKPCMKLYLITSVESIH